MSFLDEIFQGVDFGIGANDPDGQEIDSLKSELEKARVDADYWRQRCCEAEDRINFTETRAAAALISQNEALKADLAQLQKELHLYQAQLDIVYRIFPAAPDRYA